MEAEWLVIPFDRAVQVAACSIVGQPRSFRGAPTGPREARPDERLRASPESHFNNLWIPGSCFARPGMTKVALIEIKATPTIEHAAT